MESGAKYIFGEFTSEEVQQYFQNAHISVELPPCSEDAADDATTNRGGGGGGCSGPAESSAGGDGGDASSVLGPPALSEEAGGPSTLNPRAPEFCLPLEQPAASFARQPAPLLPVACCAAVTAAATEHPGAALPAATEHLGAASPAAVSGLVRATALPTGPGAPLTFGHPSVPAAVQLPLFVRPPASALASGGAAAAVPPVHPLVPVRALPVGLAPPAAAAAFFGGTHAVPVMLLQPLPAFNNGDEMGCGEAGTDGNGEGPSRSAGGGPRERRNKKKRPPGYYGLQEGAGAVNGMSCPDDGDEAAQDPPFAPPSPEGKPPQQPQLPSPPPTLQHQQQPQHFPESASPAPRPAKPTKQPVPAVVVPAAAAALQQVPVVLPRSVGQPADLPGTGQQVQPVPSPVMMMMLMNGPQGLPVEALPVLLNQLGMPTVPGAAPTAPPTVPMTLPLLVLPQRAAPVTISVAPQAAVPPAQSVPPAVIRQPGAPTAHPTQQQRQEKQPQVGNGSSGLITLATRSAQQLPVSAIRTGGSFKFGGDTNFADVSGRQRDGPPVVFTSARATPRAVLLRDGASGTAAAVGDQRPPAIPANVAKQPRPMATIAPISFGPAAPAPSEVIALLQPAATGASADLHHQQQQQQQQRAGSAAGNAWAPAWPRDEEPAAGTGKGSAQLNGVEARSGAAANVAGGGAGGWGGRALAVAPAAVTSPEGRPRTPTSAPGSSCSAETACAAVKESLAAAVAVKDAQASAVGKKAVAVAAARPAPAAPAAAAVTAAGKEASAGAEARESPAVTVAAIAAPGAPAIKVVASDPAPDAKAQPPVLSGVKTWASLFSSSKQATASPGTSAVARLDQPAGDGKPGERSAGTQDAAAPSSLMASPLKAGPVSVADDVCAARIAELLSATPLSYKPLSVQPRGLMNRGNWCYINSTLQALVACAPLYNLLRALPVFGESERPASATPVLDAFVRLVKEFGSTLPPSKPKSAGLPEKSKDLRVGSPFEPAFIYKLLSIVKSSLCDKGRQEDAEEFLGFAINGLHDEMLSLRRRDGGGADGGGGAEQQHRAATNGVSSDCANSDGCPEADADVAPGGPRGARGNGVGLQPEGGDGHVRRAHGDKREDGGQEEEEEEEEWEQVGPRNRSAITRSAEFVRSPITDIFGGCIRSAVYQAGVKESATLQPFLTLPLDVSAERVWTLRDALEGLVAREAVQGYTTKNRQEVEVCRRITLEELPPVLVLHLKRFVYDKTGGSQKLLKAIDYPLELEISKDLLSPIAKVKLSKGQRSYRLFAVTCHHGSTAAGGHYTTDVHHAGLGLWLHHDDQGVRPTALSAVLKPVLPRTAYLLYYRRADVQ